MSDAPFPDSRLSAETQYRLLAENSSDIVYQTNGLDIEWISPSVQEQLGWSPDELVGQPASALLSPNQDLSWVTRNRERLEAGLEVNQQMLLLRRDGRERWYSGRARPMQIDGVGVAGFMVGLHDIHDQVRVQQALTTSERIYRSAIENAGVGVVLLNPDLKVLDVNEAFCEFVGRNQHELIEGRWQQTTHPDDLPAEEALMREIVDGTRETFRRQKRYLYSDGSTRHGDLTVAAARDDRGELLLITKQIIDITAQVRANERLTEMATTDPLTGLANRATIMRELETALRRSATTGAQIGAVFIDLDGFRLVNESMGHAAGDLLITEVAHRLQSTIGSPALVGRFGGDEFVILVPSSASEASIEVMASDIADALSHDFSVHGRRLVITASIGAALSQPDSSPASLIQEAGVALTEAKRSGRGKCRTFNLGMASAAIRRLVVEGELREALDRNEFVVYYQPVHQLSDSSRIGFEALVRWEHPRDGMRMPDQFLPVAEESGLIIRIGRAVLRQVCRDLAEHPEMPEKVGVNVSAVELDDPDWLANTLAIIDDEGVDRRRIVIELTETAVMSTRRDLSDDLEHLRKAGIEIFVDDFGTGYSSISLLRDLPVSGLKLDRSFVSTLGERQGSGYALAEGLAQLTRAIGLEGTAEGVETEVQAAFLRAMGWTHAQGWLFGRPAPLAHWLDA